MHAGASTARVGKLLARQMPRRREREVVFKIRLPRRPLQQAQAPAPARRDCRPASLQTAAAAPLRRCLPRFSVDCQAGFLQQDGADARLQLLAADEYLGAAIVAAPARA